MAVEWEGLDVNPILDLAQNVFSATLDAIPEAKTLLIDPTLAGPLGLMTDLAALRQRGVEKMFWMEKVDNTSRVARLQAPTKHVLYLCRPEISWMKTLAAHYAADTATQANGIPHYTYTVAFLPHRTETCLHFLQEKKLLQHIRVLDMGLEFTVLHHDLLSLEDPYAWPRLFLHGDHTPLFHAAQALMTMQRTYGLFPRIVGKGDLANRLCDLLVRQRREHLTSDGQEQLSLRTAAPAIDALIVLDRTVDLATPLSTQLTYEGLVDEVIGITNGFIDVDAAWVGGAQSTGTGARKKVQMDGAEDALLASIRDDNFAIVGEKLHRTAKRLSKDYEGRHQANTVRELHAFVTKLGSLQSEHASLRLHTCITEYLLATSNSERFHHVLEVQQNLVAGVHLAQQLQAIEELVDVGTPVLTVLRLACLASYINQGLKPAWLETFRTTVIHAYGFAYMPVLMALEKMKILYATPTPTPKAPRVSKFGTVLKPLCLVDDDVDERTPDDISYVFSGYAPLSIRLIQTICQHDAHLHKIPVSNLETLPNAARIAGWHGVEESVLQLPGATFDFMQVEDEAPMPDDMVRTTVVFFVGGVTYAEMAALRLMSQQQRTRRFVVATTSMINGNTLLQSLQQEP
ncbi:Vacuolar protein-sorting-associated protein 33 [Malassezia pachydermatis]|uniref:Atp binding protein n=1 Tax=Malassezia pachydermatis TaxID=77020 RepID=A0A0M9VR14_9BASI|nr:atp binding protein [Malassezia pachydermatis]KOS16135.1 atp binding protein [Malassezia pachydermatis]